MNSLTSYISVIVRQALAAPEDVTLPIDLHVGPHGGGIKWFTYDCVGELITQLIELAIIISAIIFLVMLVWGGMQLLLSGGDKAHVESAQKRITYSFMGLALIACSWAIFVFVVTFFGITGDICDIHLGGGGGGVPPTYSCAPQTCVNLGGMACTNAGGIPEGCTNSSGGSGTCCL